MKKVNLPRVPLQVQVLISDTILTEPEILGNQDIRRKAAVRN
jgi:hypothetical protein